MAHSDSSETPVAYRFGRFVLRLVERQLDDAGEPTRLGARAFDLLQALIERRDRTVERAELFDIVWPGRVVEDHNLQVQVLALRKVLGPQAIATVPGRGYRFALPVDVVMADRAEARSIGESKRVRHAAAGDEASANAGAAAAGNLPAHPGALFGRAGDIAHAQALLERHRLVTVAGPGGIGKTRLALAVAGATRAAFADGAWIVELAPLAAGASTATIVATVSRALGFTATEARSTAAGLARSVASLSLLLVLDNCEHVLDGAAELALALIEHAPRVRLLVTSQDLLRVRDEQVYRLGPLALPPWPAGAAAPPSPPLTPQAALAFGAVSMFVARVQAADRNFELDASNVAAAVEICQRLDGIALALELAAARVPHLGIEGVRANLDQRFRVLTRGARTAADRHQTLLGAFEWSHGLLAPGEQAVFRRLGVFKGSFGLAAAQRVAAGRVGLRSTAVVSTSTGAGDETAGRHADIDAWDVLDALGALIDRSLVVADADVERPRYCLLESTRAYALHQLAAADETGAVRARHAATTLDVFKQAEAVYLDTPVFQWLEALTPDLDNWREAFAWTMDAATAGDAGADPARQGDRAAAVERAIELAAYGTAFLAIAGLGAEAQRACERVRRWVDASSATRHASPDVVARYWLAIAQLGGALVIGPAPTYDAARRAVALYRDIGDAQRLYWTLGFIEQFGERVGDIDAIAPAIAEMRALESPSWSVLRCRVRRQCEARQMRRDGQWAENRDAFLGEARLFDAAGDERNAWYALHAAASAELSLGDLDGAVSIMLPVVDRIHARGAQRQFWPQIAMFAAALLQKCDRDGDLAPALPLVREVVALLRVERALWWTIDELTLVPLNRGDFAAAARLQGWADAELARGGYAQRAPFFAQSHARLRERLAHALPAEALARELEAGTRLTEDELASHILGEGSAARG